MEFDWIDAPFDTKAFKPREIEEAFEDPFSIRVLPESPYGDDESRFILLGKTIGNKDLFIIFWTDGKKARVIAVREMTGEETAFYNRRNADIL